MKGFPFLIFTYNSENNITKLDSRYRKCVYLRIKNGLKGSILYNIQIKHLLIYRDTIFLVHLSLHQTSNYV